MPTSPDPFATSDATHQVLAVARSVPAVNRLLDVLALLGDDALAVTFTVSPGSASEEGVLPLLRDAGVTRVIPWREAARRRFALALAASPRGALHQLRAPVLLMPHGAGHNRLVDTRPGDPPVASGLAPAQLLHRPVLGRTRVVPARIALSHSEQLTRLRGSCPPAADRAVVVGDPTFDRLLAHTGRRDRYREALRVTAGQRLVVLASTWNHHSLLGEQRELVRRLLAELPMDEYRVALVAHPNVWYRDGEAQLRLWFTDQIEAGMSLVPPHEGWRAALVAADVVVGDHGSVTYYAAALGRPVLLAAFDATELDPRSPLLDFRSRVPALAPEEPLRSQVERAVAGGGVEVTDLMVDHPGESARRLRAVMYELLELPVPHEPAHYLALPDPAVPHDEAVAWRVAADIDDGGDPPGAEDSRDLPRVALRRYPAGAPASDPEAPRRLLVVDRENTNDFRAQSADAWSQRRPHPERRAADWLVDTLTERPRADVAAAATAAGHALLLDRSGRYLRVHGDAPGLDAAVVAAVAAAWRRSGRGWDPWRDGVRVRLGGSDARLNVTPSPPDLPVFADSGSGRRR